MSKIVVYGIDVGKDSTRWSRLSISSSFSYSNNSYIAIDVYAPEKNNGKYSLNNLAEWVCQDMKAGKLIALGIEAPMWRPDSNNAFILTERFPSEANRQYWRGLGAEATEKAKSIIRPLLNLIKLKREADQLHFETTLLKTHWSKDSLLLFEGYVTGKFKPDYKFLKTIVKKRDLIISKSKVAGVKLNDVGNDALDGFVLALSFWIHYYQRYDLLLQLTRNSNFFTPKLFFVDQMNELLIDEHGNITSIPFNNMWDVESHFHSASKKHEIQIYPMNDIKCEIYGIKFEI